MRPFFKLTAILLNLFMLVFLFYQIKLKRNAENEVLYLRSLINSIDAEGVKIEDRLIGKELPSLSSLTDLENNQNFLEGKLLDGRKIVILFSSMSCQACTDGQRQFWTELPGLAKAKRTKIIAIATGTSRSEARIFTRSNRVQIPVAFDQNASLATGLKLGYDNVAVLLVNSRDKIALAYVSTGVISASDREKLFLEKLKNILEFDT